MTDEYWSNPITLFFRRVLGPLFLLLVCPPFAIILWYTLVYLDGSLLKLFAFFGDQGFFAGLHTIWAPVFWGSKTAWTMIALFAAVQLAFMRLLPGKEFRGPVTPKGNVPIYKANGPIAFFVTVGLYCLLSFGFGLFSPTIIYDNLGYLLGALNIFALAFCLFLYIKGRYFPSSSDGSVSGNFIFDYYWGTELFPRLFGWDLKMFTNCRFGMMGWPLILISYAAKQQELYGLSSSMLVAVGLQLIYIAKFFHWETGYLGSLDIMHDRAGFYICWGVLVWVPSVYTSSTLYLVNHPNALGTIPSILIFCLGIAAIFINYFSDAQRQRVRATNGNTKVWGKKPVLIEASYQTADGENRKSLLLTSGWWGLSRHFHYIPEWLGALLWSLPVLFDHLLPWFYVIFLGILLTDRALRDDKRCELKYGEDWAKYKKRVPYKIIPGIF